MTDWSELQGKAADPAYVKRNLPVAYVLEVEGHLLEQKGDILACRCPFHVDSDPSCDVFGDGRWGCFPCGIGGDVLDLVGKLYGLDKFAQRMEKAMSLLSEMPSDWTPPAPVSRRSAWDPERMAAFVQAAEHEDPAALYDFLEQKSGVNPRLSSVDPEELRMHWRVGSHGDEIIVPYWTRTGELVAYKHRSASTEAKAAPGSQLTGALYGEWLDTNPDKPVLLCEGESDTWAAHAAVGQKYAVLGLSAGAGAHPKQAPSLAGRHVTLAFDGDPAGRKASVTWSEALIAEDCTVELLPVPDGQDLCKVQDIGKLLDRTRSLKPRPDAFKEIGDTYVRPGKETNAMLTNWRIEPQVEMVGDQGSAYEGVLHPGGKRVTITSGDLSTKARIVTWCSAKGVSWLGSDRDAQQLLALLQSEGPYLSSGTLVHHAGLYDGSFVWPGGRIGADRLVYSPPTSDVSLDQLISVPSGDWTVAQVRELRNLHQPAVMDPILAWLAAAPIRSLLSAFPTLAITGSSGSGKTTLLDTVVPAFSGSRITSNLTSTTRHAVAAFLASTNTFPVWFDEYRPGGRKDTMQFLEQVIRDAYTMQKSTKGGMGDNWAAVASMDTHAPLIVSGEDTFTETSHTERMINLPLPVTGKRPEVLSRVREWGETGFAHAYLSWLAGQMQSPDFDLTVTPDGPEGLPTRQRDNLGVLRLGWSLLSDFCMQNGMPLTDCDLSLVTGAGEEASGHNPIKDAIKWLLDEPESSTILRHGEDDRIYIRVTNFVTYINRNGSFTLPGRAAAVKRYMMDNYDGVEAVHSFFGGKNVSCLSISREAVG